MQTKVLYQVGPDLQRGCSEAAIQQVLVVPLMQVAIEVIMIIEVIWIVIVARIQYAATVIVILQSLSLLASKR